MEYIELPAPAPIDAFVHCFWFLRGRDDGAEPQTIVTDGRVEIILHLADTFFRLDATGGRHRQDTSLLAGQLTAPMRIAANGMVDTVGIRFRTAAARAVVGVPLGEFTNHVESLSSVAPALAAALQHAAARYREPHARVTSLAAALERVVRGRPDSLAGFAVRELGAPAAPTVGALARSLGVSTRTLERRVQASSGLAPAVLKRALRFRRVFRLLDGAPIGTWAQVAASAGYFDQAHLIRDFRQFAGAAPSEFFRTDPALARAIMSGEESAA